MAKKKRSKKRTTIFSEQDVATIFAAAAQLSDDINANISDFRTKLRSTKTLNPKSVIGASEELLRKKYPSSSAEMAKIIFS